MGSARNIRSPRGDRNLDFQERAGTEWEGLSAIREHLQTMEPARAHRRDRASAGASVLLRDDRQGTAGAESIRRRAVASLSMVRRSSLDDWRATFFSSGSVTLARLCVACEVFIAHEQEVTPLLVAYGVATPGARPNYVSESISA
jgi:hypothetical protein